MDVARSGVAPEKTWMMEPTRARSQAVLRYAVSEQCGQGGTAVVRFVPRVQPHPAHESVPALVMSPVRNVRCGLSRCRRSRLMNCRSRSPFSAVNSPAMRRLPHAVSSALSTVVMVVSPACAIRSGNCTSSRSKSCSWRWRSAKVIAPICSSVDSRSMRAREHVRLRPRCVRLAPRVRPRAAFPLFPVEEGLMAAPLVRFDGAPRVGQRKDAARKLRPRSYNISSLSAGVGTTLSAGVAAHGHARQVREPRGEKIPYPHGNVFQAGLRQAVDLVQQAMVERLADAMALALDLAEVRDETACRVGLAFERHLDLERMAVQVVVGVARGEGVEAMGGVEAETVRDLHG